MGLTEEWKGLRKIISEPANRTIESIQSEQWGEKRVEKNHKSSLGTYGTVKSSHICVTGVLRGEEKGEAKAKQTKNRIKPKKSKPRLITFLKTFKHHPFKHFWELKRIKYWKIREEKNTP